jgi:hypothetical protein
MLSMQNQQWHRDCHTMTGQHFTRAMARLTASAGGVMLAAFFVPCAAVGQSHSLVTVAMRHGVKLDSNEIAQVERGDPDVRILATQDTRDVALFGVIRLSVTRDVYLRRVQNFRGSLRGPARARFGIFSDPAALADVDGVVITQQDANGLRNCHPGDCEVKLPAAEMQRLQSDVDWSAPDLLARLTAIAKQRMLRYVTDYRERGNAALTTYDDRPTVKASDAFAAVFAQSGYLNSVAPALATYQRTFPRGRPGGLADVFFWSEDVAPRLRPTISITHASVYTPPELGGTSLIVSKQIYANHYYEAALEVRSVVDRDVENEPASAYLIVERRYRFDNLPRGGILNIRGRAVNGLRDQLVAELRRERAAL